MSKNSPDISLRIFRSIEHYGLDITRSFFTSGAPMAPYLAAFRTDLFLSACEEDVRAAIEAGIAAGIVCGEGNHYKESPSDGKIRIAFDADAVIFPMKQRMFSGKKDWRHLKTVRKEGGHSALRRSLCQVSAYHFRLAAGICAGGIAHKDGTCYGKKCACP